MKIKQSRVLQIRDLQIRGDDTGYWSTGVSQEDGEFYIAGCCAYLRQSAVKYTIRPPSGTLEHLTRGEVRAYAKLITETFPGFGDSFTKAADHPEYQLPLDYVNSIMNYGALMMWRHIWRDPYLVVSLLNLVQNKGLTVCQAFVQCYTLALFNYPHYHIASSYRFIAHPEMLKEVFSNPKNTPYYDTWVLKVLPREPSSTNEALFRCGDLANKILSRAYSQESYSVYNKMTRLLNTLTRFTHFVNSPEKFPHCTKAFSRMEDNLNDYYKVQKLLRKFYRKVEPFLKESKPPYNAEFMSELTYYTEEYPKCS